MNEIKIDEFEATKKIGQGKTGDVFLGKNKQTGALFALKKIPKSNSNIIDIKKKHDNLKSISFIKQIDLKETEDYYVFIMEYMNGGDLSKIIDSLDFQNKLPLDEITIANVLRQLINQVIVMEQNQIDYSYIKIKNILVNFHNKEDLNELKLNNAGCKVQIKINGIYFIFIVYVILFNAF